jgi:hypothetical protein
MQRQSQVVAKMKKEEEGGRRRKKEEEGEEVPRCSRNKRVFKALGGTGQATKECRNIDTKRLDWEE